MSCTRLIGVGLVIVEEKILRIKLKPKLVDLQCQFWNIWGKPIRTVSSLLIWNYSSNFISFQFHRSRWSIFLTIRYDSTLKDFTNLFTTISVKRLPLERNYEAKLVKFVAISDQIWPQWQNDLETTTKIFMLFMFWFILWFW